MPALGDALPTFALFPGGISLATIPRLKWGTQEQEYTPSGLWQPLLIQARFIATNQSRQILSNST